MKKKIIVYFIIACVACSSNEEVDFYRSSLFHDVQMNAVFSDSKTFADCIPKHDIESIISHYEKIKNKPDVDLHEFVRINFDLPERPKSTFKTDTSLTMEAHLTRLWPVLTRKADHSDEGSSLISLPYDYVVPGGRFSEIYYWDSYFTMLGLKAQKRFDLMHNMVKNFEYLIDRYGFIPNGNRSYYITRSQPPFFSLMIREIEADDTLAAVHYLKAMEAEYTFWMDGIDSVFNPGDAHKHVVMMSNGAIMNRYYDKGETPRPESYKEDYTLAQKYNGDDRQLYRDIRSAAESGWDFSCRWFRDGRNIATIHTTEIIPVDLNALLVHLEKMIAKGYRLSGDAATAKQYDTRADLRRKALLTYCWNAEENFFMDYDFVAGKTTTVKSLAGMYPFFLQLAQKDMADQAAVVLAGEFLKPGGLVTTLNNTGQQWDAPNGWAPLQWLAYQGLKNYRIDVLADEICRRWLHHNERVFKTTGKMMEKYNVIDTVLLAGGGEYPNQDGFGWTNGVALQFLNTGLK